uniref:AAA family ATPase n=1 Tax=Marinobacterium profundum TaxID=1714300 RepID=UPI0008348293|nr:AAA family ATPase [Marinobacterium profundum]
MLQSPEALRLPKELRVTLSELMVGATFTEEVICDDCLPVLLVLRSHAVTAFAVGDENDYEPLYEAFKKYYLKQALEWSAKDVSFVFCIPSDIVVHESFRSRVEVDVYFCRKYVIQLERNLASGLARLPFLPLSPISPGVQTRPPSAQTLLKQSNLTAELASALVVPSKSSANKILAACLEGTFGEPNKIAEARTVASSEAQAEDQVQTTLKSISIENFRAYRTKKEFTLGSAVTVLYGPNGFGKTSFFDAIDFVVTGGVGRLSKVSRDLAKAAKHLDSDGEPTEVSLTFERDGKQHVITRNLAERNNALVDGMVTPRKDVLSLLTGGASVGADRVDNMVALFRATHLFSQDSQELTKHVEERCELPADIVSRMLAFEDYVSGLKKTEDVLKLARKMLMDAQTQAQDIRMSINKEREELRRLEGLAAENTSPGALDERFTELQRAILTAGFNMTGIDPRDTRSLRAMLESSAAEAAGVRGAISKALEHAGSLKTLRGQLEPIAAQLEERKTQLEHALITADDAVESLAALTSALAEAKAQDKAVQNRKGWFLWAVSVQPEYERLNTQVQVLTDGLSMLTQRLEQQRETQAKALCAQQESVATVQRLEATLKTAGDLRSRVQWVSELAGHWEHAEPKLITARALETELQSAIETRHAQLDEAQQAVLAHEHLVARLERELNSAKSNDTTLKGLIAELRTHVDGATCVLCGHNHGSQNELLAAIDRRMEHGDLVVRLSETLANERVKLQTQVAARQSVFDRLSQEEQRLVQTKTEREQLERQQTTYETALSSFGILLSSNTAQQLAQMSMQVHDAEQNAANAASNARKLLVALETALASATDGYKTLEREHQASSTALEDMKHRINELVVEANRGTVNLAAGLQALSEAQRDVEVRVAQASSSVQAANTKLDAQKAVSDAAKASLATARTRHQQASQTWNSYQTNMQTLGAALTAAGFGNDVSEEQLHQQVQMSTEHEVTALGLRDRVAKLEVAVDTAATSAAFQNLRERIQANEKLVQQADERAQEVKPWISYFEGITKLLGGEQAIATKHFITQYGPRTAVIQQRLRPVYGFEEIEVSSKDSNIGIRVNRNGEALKPTHYFSQSQIQTLILGLFLTACSSQTWSGFSSIMMDDPVTHFDDLNTYALLDLILGLQSSTEGARQFVISTCDEKLLQLARQKFKHMGAEAKFYRFSAIGAGGPMVNEIST